MATGLNFSDNDLYNTIKDIVNRGGTVFPDVVPAGAVNATATGTGTARQSITTTYPVPNSAVELLAWAPLLCSTADAAADSKFAMFDIQGTSFKRQPQQVLGPVGSVVLSAGSTRFTPMEWFNTFAPVVQGDQYDFGVTPLVANTHNMKAAVTLLYSTVPSRKATIFSQVSAVNAIKNAGQNSTGTLTLSAANLLYEIMSGVCPEAAAVAQEIQILTHTVTSGSLTPIQTFNYSSDPPAQIAATSGDTQVPQISRFMPLGSSFKQPNPLLTFTSNIDVATSNNLNVAHCIRYTSI